MYKDEIITSYFFTGARVARQKHHEVYLINDSVRITIK